MARAEIRSQSWGVVQDAEGNVQSGLVFTIENTDASAATVYTAETGGSTTTPVTSSDGEISGWLEEGSYDVTDPRDSDTQRVEVVTGLAASRLAVITEAPLNVQLPEYGALGDDSNDDYAAFVAAHAALPAHGGEIYIPPGTYLLSDTWTIDKLCRIVGAGTGVNLTGGTHWAPTLLKPATTKTGIVISGSENPPCYLAGFALLSRSTTTGTDDGIRINGHGAVLDHVTASNFGRYGIRIDTTAGGNANLSQLRRVRAEWNRSDGFYIKSADSQAMKFEVCDASRNEGWGFNNDGPAKNTFDSCHCDANTLGAFRDAGSSNIYINPYVEGGTGNNVTFTAASNGLFWIAPGVYSNPTITDSGGNNSIFVAGAGNTPTWNQLATIGNLYLNGAGQGLYARNYSDINQVAMGVRISTDSSDRLTIDGGGRIDLGPGNASRDTNLYRSAADTLKTDDKLHVVGELELDGALNHDGTTVGFNAATPVGKRTLGAAATDAATTQTLANNLRQALIDLGLGQT